MHARVNMCRRRRGLGPAIAGARALALAAAITAAVSMAAAPAPAATASGSADAPIAPGPPEVHFRLEAGGPGRAAAERCRAALLARGAHVAAATLPLAAAPAPIVCLLLDSAGFQARFGAAIPDWGVGVALPGGRLIALDVERQSGVPRPLEEVFLHELAHALLEQGLRGASAPAWFHEGVAQISAGQWRLRDTMALVLTGAVPPLWRLEGRFPANADWAAQAYRTSLLAVQTLRRRHGGDVVPRIVEAVAATGDFEAGFAAATGESVDDFAQAFADGIHSRLGWLFMLTNWPVLFALLAMLFLAGAAARFVRNRRRLARWTEEEEEDGGGGRG